MTEQGRYISVLIESLQKKKMILQKIQKKNEEQRDILLEEELNMGAFDQNTEEKGKLIEKLLNLDEGFQNIYDRVNSDITLHKDIYENEIKVLQDLIREITALGVAIEAEETKNKTLLEQKFNGTRQKMKQSKISAKVAVSYYDSMSRVNYIDPQLMDKKK